jgi:hypothetical protein
MLYVALFWTAMWWKVLWWSSHMIKKCTCLMALLVHALSLVKFAPLSPSYLQVHSIVLFPTLLVSQGDLVVVEITEGVWHEEIVTGEQKYYKFQMKQCKILAVDLVVQLPVFCSLTLRIFGEAQQHSFLQKALLWMKQRTIFATSIVHHLQRRVGKISLASSGIILDMPRPFRVSSWLVLHHDSP